MKKKPIKGHVFAEVMVNKDRWILIDPDSKKICIDSGREWEIFEIYDVGLDSHDFGLTSFAELKKKFLSTEKKEIVKSRYVTLKEMNCKSSCLLFIPMSFLCL
ncbi:MAG: hypothetical protein ABIA11_03755 [Patescibacteria group bacterium]